MGPVSAASRWRGENSSWHAARRSPEPKTFAQSRAGKWPNAISFRVMLVYSLASHKAVSENTSENYEDLHRVGERLSDRLSRFGGSWTFIVLFFSALIIWIAVSCAFDATV